MWKLLIADDEPKIRRGLRKALDWESLGIEIIGDAEDGELALEMAIEKKPDIMLVDICMPFLNGLDLIGKLNAVVKNCIIIIITGHDEFSYAQRALKLGVFDYLLKPVMKKDLFNIIKKVENKLEEEKSNEQYLLWKSNQLDENEHIIKEKFLNKLINGELSQEEINIQSEFLKIKFSESCGIFILKIMKEININDISKKWDNKLLIFAIKNIVKELFSDFNTCFVFNEEKGNNIIIITNINNTIQWYKMGDLIEKKINKYLNQSVLVVQDRIENSIYDCSNTYVKLLNMVEEKTKYKPIVLLITKYIEENYNEENFNISKAAEKFNISATYLSRLLKQDIGLSFIDYLTNIRIIKAIQIMKDPTYKLYEVAELVGYNDQHYFSKAFKKVVGVSPVKYRGGNI